jgi:hypothetical protein
MSSQTTFTVANSGGGGLGGPGATRSGRPARPGGRRRAAARVAWAAAGIVLALMAASAPAAYAASGTAPAAPSSRSGTPPAPPKTAKATQSPCVWNGMPYSGPTWMHDIAPCLEGRALSEIAIPGSHDSGTYSFGILGAGFATTQDEDITQQLNDGMRRLDIRVDYQTSGFSGPGWYVYHGPIHSLTLTLDQIFAEIFRWAVQPGHGQEIIKLDLDIEGGDDRNDCLGFGNEMGNALLTPNVLQVFLGTANPGQLTLGQLWSLNNSYPNSNGAARVIMNNIRCLEYAKTGGAAKVGEWPFQGGYYAEQCSADGLGYHEDHPEQRFGVIDVLLPAAENRYSAGGGIPQTYSTPAPPPYLYGLEVEATPESYPICAVTPLSLLPDEKEVIQALFNYHEGVFWQLNFVSGDFVEQTDLLGEVVAVDTLPRVPDTPEITDLTTGVSQVAVAFSELGSGAAPILNYTVSAKDEDNFKGTRSASGGSSPITVSGLITGDTYAITASATNSNGTSPPSAAKTIIPGGMPPRFVSGPSANGIVGQPYTSGFAVTGVPAPTVSQVGGQIPPGLTLDSHGSLKGIPKTAGRYYFAAGAVNPLGIDGFGVDITIADGVIAKIAGCSTRGANAWGCALEVKLGQPLAVNTVFSVDIGGGGGFTNPSGGDSPQVIDFHGCQVAPLPSPYYPGNGGYNHYDVNISSGGCTAGAVVYLEEAVTAAGGATITQSVTVPGLPKSTASYVLAPQVGMAPVDPAVFAGR